MALNGTNMVIFILLFRSTYIERCAPMSLITDTAIRFCRRSRTFKYNRWECIKYETLVCNFDNFHFFV